MLLLLLILLSVEGVVFYSSLAHFRMHLAIFWLNYFNKCNNKYIWSYCTTGLHYLSRQFSVLLLSVVVVVVMLTVMMLYGFAQHIVRSCKEDFLHWISLNSLNRFAAPPNSLTRGWIHIFSTISHWNLIYWIYCYRGCCCRCYSRSICCWGAFFVCVCVCVQGNVSVTG